MVWSERRRRRQSFHFPRFRWLGDGISRRLCGQGRQLSDPAPGLPYHPKVERSPVHWELYVQARRPENLTLSIARAASPSHPLRLQGVNRGVSYQQYQPVVMLGEAYVLQWDGRAPEDVTLYPINFNRGDWVTVALCYPKGTAFAIVGDLYRQQTGKAHSVKHYLAASSLHGMVNRTSERLFHFNRALGYLFVHLQAHEARTGHSYCSQHGCERLKITATMPSGAPWSCPPDPFSEKDLWGNISQPPAMQRRESPCRQCGVPWVAVTNTPYVTYVRIQIQSPRRADMGNSSRFAFIKVNDEVFFFHGRGLFFLVLDACSGVVVSRRPFEIATFGKSASALSTYVATSIKDRSVVLVCSRGEEMPAFKMPIFTRLGSATPVVFHEKGSLAMLGYKGTPKPSWIKIHSQTADQKPASLQSYVPLRLREYRCPADGTDV